MVSNPFTSDYAGTSPTQAASAGPVPAIAAEATAAVEKSVGLDIASGFKITPIPTVSGKPKRVIIKGKVARD